MEKRRVLPYGKSLLLGVAAASLRSCAELEILPPTFALTEETLAEQMPDVILFDMETDHPELVIGFLEARPGLVLIGIGPSSDKMLVLSSREQRAVAMSDIAQVVLSSPFSASTKEPAVTASQISSSSAQPAAAACGPAAPPPPSTSQKQYMPGWLRWRISREEKMIAGLAGLGIGVLVMLVLVLTNSNATVPLAGTAVGTDAVPLTWLAFVAGGIIGGLLITLWFKWKGTRP